jgi:hypothetical protein
MFRKKTKRIEVKVEAELNNPPAVYVNDSEHAAADAIISVDHPPQSDTTTDKLLVEYGDCSGEQKNRFTPWLPRPVTETAMVLMLGWPLSVLDDVYSTIYGYDIETFRSFSITGTGELQE